MTNDALTSRLGRARPVHDGASSALALLTAAVLAVAPASVARAAGAAPTPSLGDRLAGNTLSAVAFVPHEAPRGGGELTRVVFQSFMRADGSALYRRWDPARDAYTAPAETHWNVAGDTLCMDVPGSGGDGRLCMEVHVWGPRIAGNGTGTGRFAMLDGNIEPGNTIVAQR